MCAHLQASGQDCAALVREQLPPWCTHNRPFPQEVFTNKDDVHSPSCCLMQCQAHCQWVAVTVDLHEFSSRIGLVSRCLLCQTRLLCNTAPGSAIFSYEASKHWRILGTVAQPLGAYCSQCRASFYSQRHSSSAPFFQLGKVSVWQSVPELSIFYIIIIVSFGI